MKKRIFALMMCFCMVFANVTPATALAQNIETACENHTEHTAECGYSEGAAEIPCTHICNDSCTLSATSCVHTHDENCGYVAAVEGTPCSHVCGEECAESCIHTEHTDCGHSEGMAEIPCAHSCTEDSGCIVTPEGCPHIHDEICGYAPAAETSPCTHSCESCAAEPEPNLICTCGTDDPAIHSTLCPAYAAPENPECFCVEKCPEDAPNEWCDVCGVQGAAACEGGGDEAAAYAEPQVLGDFSVTVESGSATLSGVELELAAGGTYTVSMADGITKSLNTIRITGSGSGVVTNITVNGVNCAVLEDLSTSTVNLTLMGENVFSIRGVAGGNPLTIGGTGSLTADEGINADNCEIIINSGTIIANGIVYSAGIGGGNNASGTVTINGGIVTATGGQDAAGIGGGNNASGTVTINGGTVTATGAGYAAGIGGGVGGAGTVAISGGTITSHSSFYQSIGGSGNDESSVIITGGGFTLDPHVSGAYKIVRHATGGNVAVKLNGTDIVAAGANQTVSVIPTPNEGYELKGLYLLGSNDTAPTENHYIDTDVFRTIAQGGSYDFDMPNQNVTVHAVFQQTASVGSYPITTEVIGYPGARLYAYTGTYPYDAELNDAGAVTEAALYSTFNVMLDASTEETSINKLPEGYELVGLYINPTDYPETHYIDSTAFPSNYMSWGPEYIYGGTYYTCMVFGPTHVVAVVANTQTSEETNPTVKLNGVEIKSNQYLPSGATAASALTQVAPSGGYARLYENNGILTLELNNAAFTSGGLQLVGQNEAALTIKLTGDNALTGTNHGLLDDYTDGTGTKITFTGTGSLTATGGTGTGDVGIFGNDAIIVNDGVTIAATGGGYGIRAGAGFTSSGNVTASGGEYGIVTTAGNLAISGGTLTASGSIKALQPGIIPAGSVTCSVSPVHAGDNETSATEVWNGTGSLPDLTQYKYVQVGNNAPDIIPPVLNAGEVSRTSNTEATVKFTSSEAGTYTYTVVPSGSTAVGMAISGDCTAGENTITLTNLTAGVQDISIRVTDAAENASDWLKITIPAYEAPATTYTVSISSSENGTVSADKTTVAEGDTVTLTVTPADGYELNMLSVLSGGSNVSTKDEGNGKHTFTMPAGNVTVTATFSPKSTEPATGYDLWVGGEEVTSENLSGTGWAYDPTTKTLTLNGYEYTGAGNESEYEGFSFSVGIYSASELKVKLEGNNVLNSTGEGGYGIAAEGDLSIEGTGTLDISAVNGISANGEMTISGGTVKVTTPATDEAINSYGIFAGGSVTISSGTVNVTTTAMGAEAYGYGISADGNVAISGGMVTVATTATGDGAYGSGISAAGNVAISGSTVTVTTTATGEGAYGDGVYAEGSVTISGQNTSVTAQGAGDTGAAISAKAGLTITDVTIRQPEGGTVGAYEFYEGTDYYTILTGGTPAQSVTLASSTPADTTAPTLTAGAADRTSETEATVSFTSDEAGLYTCYVKDDSGNLLETTSGESITGENTITLTGLASEAKVLIIQVTDVSGNPSNMLELDIPAYVPEPELTAGEVSRTSNSDATVRFTSSQAGEYAYYVVPSGSTGLFGTVKDGDCAAGENTITLTGLNIGAQDIFIQVTNNEGKKSDWLKIIIPAYEAPTPTYTVTYTDGVDNEVIFPDQVYENMAYGDATPPYEGTFSRAGYTFAGWSPEVAATVTGNAVYTAQWTDDSTPTPTYTVTFNSNGGTGTMAAQIFTHGVAQSLTANRFTRSDYVFTGWNTEANGGGTAYSDGQSVTLTTGGLTLYAQWQKENVSTKTEAQSFDADDITDELRDKGYTTPEQIETVLKTQITQTGVPSGNTAFYDIVLLYSDDGGNTWTRADTEHFPDNGRLPISIPVPSGVDAGQYDFYGIHMFATTAFGKTAGETEEISFTERTEGGTVYLDGYVTGLSPILVGWKTSGGTDPDPTPTIAGVTVSPATATMNKGSTQQFTAAVSGTGSYNTAVTWSISGHTSSNTTINTSGLLSIGADETATTITVKATAVGDTDKYGTASVTLQTGGGAGGDTDDPSHTHSFGSWQYDSKNHWRYCSCGTYDSHGEHSFGGWKVIKEATTYTNGSKERSCSICGYTETATIWATIIPQTGDNSLIGLWITLMALSMGGIFVALRFRKRGAHETRR